MSKRDKLSLVYKFLVLGVLGTGLFLNFRLDHSGKLFLYFTILSNLACYLFYLIGFILRITKKLKKNNVYYIIKGAVTMAMTITMVVYWIMHVVDGQLPVYKDHMIACRFVHLYAPIMVMLDYVIFGIKGNLKPSYPFIWSSCLIIYGIFIIVYSLLGGTFINNDKFVYSFMNYELLGLKKVILINLILLICYTAYGSLIYNIDSILSKKKKK